MPGGVQLGSAMFWRMELQSNVKEGVSEAKAAINELDGATISATGSVRSLGMASELSTRGISATGMSAMMVGGAMLGASAAAKSMGKNMEGLAGALDIAGGAAMGLGSILVILPSFLKAYHFIQGAIIPAIMGHTAATIAQTAAIAAQTPVLVSNSAALSTTVPGAMGAAAAEEILAGANMMLYPSMLAVANGVAVEYAALEELTPIEVEAVIAGSVLAQTGGAVSMSAGTAGVAMLGQAGATETLAGAEVIATGTTITLTGALMILGSVAVIGLVIAGLYLLYENMNAGKKAAEALQLEIDDLTTSIGMLDREQTSANYLTKEAEGLYNSYKDQVNDTDDGIRTLTDHYRDLTDAMKDQAGIASDTKKNNLDIKSTLLDLSDAEEELAKPDLTPKERARALIRKQELQNRLQDLKVETKAIKDRNKADSAVITKAEAETKTKTPEEALKIYLQEIKTLETDRLTLIGLQEVAQGKVLDLQKEALAVETERAKLEFRKELIQYEKEGTAITPGMYAAIQEVPWEKEVLDQFIKERGTVTRPPNMRVPGFGEVPNPFAPSFIPMETKINPVLGNIPYQDYLQTFSPLAPFAQGPQERPEFKNLPTAITPPAEPAFLRDLEGSAYNWTSPTPQKPATAAVPTEEAVNVTDFRAKYSEWYWAAQKTAETPAGQAPLALNPVSPIGTAEAAPIDNRVIIENLNVGNGQTVESSLTDVRKTQGTGLLDILRRQGWNTA